MLADVQALLTRVLSCDEPVAALAEELDAASGLTDEERAWLEGLDADGLAMARLLVKKIRFQQVLRGDAALEKRFELDPAGFVEDFETYSAAVAPSEYFPGAEARRFRAWLEERGTPGG